MKKSTNRKPTRQSARELNAGIGSEIRRARAGKRVTQEALAFTLGYARPQTVHYIEIGEKMVSAADLAEIANALGVTVRSLYPRGSVR